ncbi:MAG: SDR family NAD(P)-dependent oxidoreductase [Pseudomonadota bacterium]
MSNQSQEKSRLALITGAGSGLGAAMALKFAQSGWNVLATDLDEARANETVENLPGEGHRSYALNVTDEARWQALRDEIEANGEQLDLLVNNAGVATGGMTGETPLEDWRWVMEINTMGVVVGCHYFVEHFRRNRSGHIINVASWAGLAAAPGIASYGTAKSAVVSFSEMLRAELHGAGVYVSVLCPAFVKTDLTSTMRAPDDNYAKRVNRWMEKSGVSADDVAGLVMRAVEKPKFLLLTHSDTRWLYRLKRWFPGLYFRLLVREAAKMEKHAAARKG